MIEKYYNEIVERCKKQNIDISGCHIYIENLLFDCYESYGFSTVSKDKKWICIPMTEYDESVDSTLFMPICFEIKCSFETFLGNEMQTKHKGYILYKREK